MEAPVMREMSTKRLRLDKEAQVAVGELTELSNLARLRRPPSTMFSTLISVLPICSLTLLELEPGAPSPLL